MKEQKIGSYCIFLSIVLALIVTFSSCNNDIFVDPIEIESDMVTLERSGQTCTVHVSGTDWRILNVHSENVPEGGYDGGGIYFVESTLVAFSIEKGGTDKLEFTLGYNITGSPLVLYITVGNRYEERIITLELASTGKIEYKGIEYILTSWSGYPSESYVDEIEKYVYTYGLEKSLFIFPPLESMPAIYKFEPFYFNEDERELAEAVSNLGVRVPIPSPTPNDYPTWSLLGDEAKLTTQQSHTNLTHFITPQKSIEVPTGTPIEISRLCRYECYGFQCTITVFNPATGKEVEVQAKLNIIMPEKIYATYNLL